METILEVLPAGGRVRRNRRWATEVTAQIIAETLEPGATVNSAATRRSGEPCFVMAEDGSEWAAGVAGAGGRG